MQGLKIIICVSAVLLLFVSPAAAQEELVFAISPMASPVSTFSSFNDFIQYLSEKTGKRVLLKQRRTYTEINDLLKAGEAHFSFTCTGAFLSGMYEFDLKVLVVPIVNGRTTYNSYIIVKKDSGIDSFEQLKGKNFAFTDPLSFSGRLYTLNLLKEEYHTVPKDFFSGIFYTASHEKSIRSVAYGLAEGASVDSLIFEDIKRMNDPAIDKLKIIKVSPPFGIPPIVVSPSTTEATRSMLIEILVSMSDDEEGRKILNGLQIEKFIKPDAEIYRTAMSLRKNIEHLLLAQ